jgi:hypothetical protein
MITSRHVLLTTEPSVCYLCMLFDSVAKAHATLKVYHDQCSTPTEKCPSLKLFVSKGTYKSHPGNDRATSASSNTAPLSKVQTTIEMPSPLKKLHPCLLLRVASIAVNPDLVPTSRGSTVRAPPRHIPEQGGAAQRSVRRGIEWCQSGFKTGIKHCLRLFHV